MNYQYRYGWSVRHYGLFFQFPQSFAVMLIIVWPFTLLLNDEQIRWLPTLIVTWSLIAAVGWNSKDSYWQKWMQDISVCSEGIRFIGATGQRYFAWSQLVDVQSYPDSVQSIGPRLGASGLLLRFDNGEKKFVFDKIEEYSVLRNMLRSRCRNGKRRVDQ